MLTDTDTGTDRNKKQDLWKAKQRYIEGLEVRKNAPKKTKRCIEGLEVKKKKNDLKKAIQRNYYFFGTSLVVQALRIHLLMQGSIAPTGRFHTLWSN